MEYRETDIKLLMEYIKTGIIELSGRGASEQEIRDALEAAYSNIVENKEITRL